MQNFPRFTSPSSPVGQLLSTPVVNSCLCLNQEFTVVCLSSGLICMHINSSCKSNAHKLKSKSVHTPQKSSRFCSSVSQMHVNKSIYSRKSWKGLKAIKNVEVCKVILSSTVSTLWKKKEIFPALHNKFTMNKKMKKLSNVLQALLDWFKACKGAGFPAISPICKMTGAREFHMQEQMMLSF